MRHTIPIGLLVILAGCAAANPELLRPWQGRTLYTCCNIHYEKDEVSDANYFVGSTLPFGSPAAVEKVSRNALTFQSGATRITLVQSYGRDQESAQQYFGKILVETDPHTRFTTFPPAVQQAINDGRVERGMSKEQVIMSLGYPPTHRTASTEMASWTYWYNRWVTYTVTFGNDGRVAQITGNTAPTRNEPIPEPTPAPVPKPAAKGKAKKK